MTIHLLEPCKRVYLFIKSRTNNQKQLTLLSLDKILQVCNSAWMEKRHGNVNIHEFQNQYYTNNEITNTHSRENEKCIVVETMCMQVMI